MCLASGVSSQRNASDESILVEHHDQVATVTLNRPDKLNALTPQMVPAYAQILMELDRDPHVRVIVVTGAGRGFCSGADLSTLAGSVEQLQQYVGGQSLSSLPIVALTLGTPVVTAINGPCAGIGFVLAVSADVRFIHPDATLSTTFARLGLVAEYGLAWLLPRLIGLPAATDLLLTGRTITGTQAGHLGLAQVSTDPRSDALSWARDVARMSSPASVATMKQQLLDADRQGLAEAVSASLVAMSRAFELPDLTEALSARASKRVVSFPPRGTPAT